MQTSQAQVYAMSYPSRAEYQTTRNSLQQLELTAKIQRSQYTAFSCFLDFLQMLRFSFVLPGNVVAVHAAGMGGFSIR